MEEFHPSAKEPQNILNISVSQEPSKKDLPAIKLPEMPVGTVEKSTGMTIEIKPLGTESPKGSVLEGISVSIQKNFGKGEFSIGKALFGLSGKEFKENVKNAIEEDADLKTPLRVLKGIGRGAGLVLGAALNLISRVVAFSISASVSVLAMGSHLVGALFKGRNSALWQNPAEAMRTIFAAGMVAGAAVGATVGTLGNALIQASLNMKFDQTKGLMGSAAGRAFKDNAVAAIGGAAVGSAISLVNPLLWRAALES